jgi:hypothetical protein
MIRTIIRCDRCSHDVERDVLAGRECQGLRLIAPSSATIAVDVCESCYYALCDWLALAKDHPARSTSLPAPPTTRLCRACAGSGFEAAAAAAGRDQKCKACDGAGVVERP